MSRFKELYIDSDSDEELYKCKSPSHEQNFIEVNLTKLTIIEILSIGESHWIGKLLNGNFFDAKYEFGSFSFFIDDDATFTNSKNVINLSLDRHAFLRNYLNYTCTRMTFEKMIKLTGLRINKI